ncbi:MAG: S8 family serine peptidase [Dehalococcoidales bacterium]|nr:S8 family serine peptidase [Dehalococcoidales bacterium]
MRRVIRITVVFSLIIGLILSGIPAAGDEEESSPEYAPDRILVKFKQGVMSAAAQGANLRLGGEVVEVIPNLDVQVVQVPAGGVLEKVRDYNSDPSVEYAEPDYIARAIGAPDDPHFIDQWSLDRIQAPEAWEVSTGNSEIRIAILDTGIDKDHEDLAAKIVSAQNFTDSRTVDDLYGHGTHVAGIAAAVANNGTGVAGLACDSSLMNMKVLGDNGEGYNSWIIGGIIHAADNGARVINLSLGNDSPSALFEDAVNYAWSKGAVVVAAAGNKSNSSPFYPAYYSNCIAVAATDQYDIRAHFSTYGNWVDLAAPGAHIYSTLPNHECVVSSDMNYGYLSGSSMAAPLVAGLAALVWDSSYGVSNASVRSRIEASADPVSGTGIYWHYGRINALRASEAIGVPAVTTSPATNTASTSATFNGNLASLGTLESVDVFFDYGTSFDEYTDSTEPRTLTQAGDFQATIEGLSPDTTYYYRATAIGNYPVYGKQEMFNTWVTPPAGKIAFISNYDSSCGIYVMNADGSDLRHFFNPPMSPFNFPAWSPDGAKLAFMNCSGAPSLPFTLDSEVWVADADGSNIKNLTNNPAADELPAWSPDGSRIAFVSERDGISAIYVMNSDGTGTTRITDTSSANRSPNWSPDGRQIAFESLRDGNSEIYIMNSDGSDVRRLTHSAGSIDPAWSPDGNQIAFCSFTQDPHNHDEIFLINVDGSELKKITDSAHGTSGPEWSQDGTKIVFSSSYYMVDSMPNSEISIVNADGSGLCRITNLPGDDYQPTWCGTSLPTLVPPSVSTWEVSGLTSTSATLHGSLISLGTASSVELSFEWGAAGGEAGGILPGDPALLTSPGAFSTDLTGLAPDTIYYYRAQAVGDGTSSGGEIIFKTEQEITLPAVATIGADPAITSARLYGDLTDMGGFSSVQVYFEWGKTTEYGNTTEPQEATAAGIFESKITGLSPLTAYHFRAAAQAGDITIGGEDKTFTTSAPAVRPPGVITLAARNIKQNAATFEGELVDPGSASAVKVSFVWGVEKGGPYPNETQPEDLTGAGPFSFNLEGLTPGTRYFYEARAEGDGTSHGEEMAFTTSKPSSGGGGGGGGGSSSLTIKLTGWTSPTTLKTGSSGTRTAAQLKSADGKLTLEWNKGTRITRNVRELVSALTLETLSDPPAPPADNSLVLAYSFGPDGAAFDPAVRLSFSYDPAALPDRMNEEDLYIAFWDGSGWAKLPGQLDRETRTVSAQIDHFSQYALLGVLPPPEEPSPTPPSTSPAEAAPETPVATRTTDTGSIASLPSEESDLPAVDIQELAPEAVSEKVSDSRTGSLFFWMLVGITAAVAIAAAAILVVRRKSR